MIWIAISSAFWLGILTAISPCPLASNIAAISFVSRHIGNNRGVLMSGLLYTAGRVIVYIALGAAITAGLMASGEVSRFLQKYLNEILGPLLILVGMILLNM
ncbi:MAG: sulfite exporter TauE/SafE family protein, partial [Lentisphaerota bacterium]